MHAIAKEGFSGRDRLTLVDLPIPEPGPDDVLVRVRAARVGPWARRLGKDASARAAGQEVLGASQLRIGARIVTERGV